MAVQPIDLQTMYSQLANVARQAATEGQGAALSQSMQTQGIINQNLQQSKAVQKAAENETESSKVKADGQNGGRNDRPSSRKKKGEESEAPEKTEYQISDPRLGQHINVTG